MVRPAVERLVVHDEFLLKTNASERSITHRPGMYLPDEFPCLDADCQYNREGTDGEPKHLDIAPIFPDIIIHKRGENNAMNLLVIEVKKLNNQEVARDRQRVCEFTRVGGRFEYKIGLLLRLPDGDAAKSADVEYEWLPDPRDGPIVKGSPI